MPGNPGVGPRLSSFGSLDTRAARGRRAVGAMHMDPIDGNIDPGSSPEVSAPFNPVIDQAVKAKDFSAFQAEKRAERLRDAGLKDTPKPSEAPATTPAEPAAHAEDQAAKGAEPAKPKGKEKRLPQLDADIQERLKRRAEIQREIDREEGRLEALRQSREPKDVKPAASSPAQPVGDGRPKLEDFEADPARYPDPFMAYTEALAEWKADQVYTRKELERRAAEQVEREHQTITEKLTTFQQRFTEAMAADPELYESIDPRIRALKPLSTLSPAERQNANPLNALAEVFITAEDPIGLMRYFSDQPDEVLRVCRLQPDQFYQALGRIAASLPSAGTSRPAAAAPAAPARTSAPPPPTTLGSRVTESGDPLENAVNRKDFGAYQREKRRRKMAELGLVR